MIRKIPGLLAFAFALALPGQASAQAALLGPGAAFIAGGVAGTATGPLNDRLAQNGYPTFDRTSPSFGIGGYRILSSGVMLSAELTGLFRGEKKYQNRDVGSFGGYATLGLGYAIVLSPRVRLYPRVGLGAGGLTLWIENADDSVDFDDVLENPSPSADLREPLLSRDGGVVDIGAGVEFLGSKRGSGPLVGVRFGYLAAPFNDSWTSYERKALDGPDASISGLYVRVVLGGAWRR